MPPPHLHPRSRMTSSLFAATVVASFLVVGVPHILPCPAPRVAFADGDMSADGQPKRRRRRRVENTEGKDEILQFETELGSGDVGRARALKRECPVPKPGGMLGSMLGFHKDNDINDPSSPSNR
ncbi:hypothetical protein NEUTE1DRAFT_78875 [Neurospora tetrasperma FGSC 2508]|uniref:Alpha-1,3-mannosyltransferase n=1 Tax=Neurospora tetrasperma (strain FGSC 2508 / ATCC MYA-4615 / P0657) TaxID=510951 RepID=F8MJC1_NEUT8|nr:uncharacterized protein NEUTE1DRAFT_78875 [Neurospora tetrasperma FGSC 2508]EGO59118.1 hypothetical protein NEUTE1DRAFT_78875 [Neurospora tetrasperma FGSC 2508]EGZ73226.1 hypothetical protein NEUTE2DRAFT_156744 [Neurospora tetrasperma FGSC 2509]